MNTRHDPSFYLFCEFPLYWTNNNWISIMYKLQIKNVVMYFFLFLGILLFSIENLQRTIIQLLISAFQMDNDESDDLDTSIELKWESS